MNKLNKYLSYGGCLVGALSFFLFVLLPAIVYGIFPQHADQVDQFMTNTAKKLHLVEIMSFVGPYLLAFLIVGVPLIAFSPLWLGYFRNRRNITRLKTVGVKGKAKIIAIQDTGITVNNSPYVILSLEIEGINAKVEINSYVSRVNVPRIGDSIEVVYDPANPNRVMPADRTK